MGTHGPYLTLYIQSAEPDRPYHYYVVGLAIDTQEIYKFA